LPQPQSFYSADALGTPFLVLLMVLTWAVSEGGMGDTTSMAIISPRVIFTEADSTAVAGTAAAGTDRRKEEMTNDKSHRQEKSAQPANNGEVDCRIIL
jgi:hypothetical protein